SVFVTLSMVLAVVSLATSGKPPLWVLMAFLLVRFSCVGMLFGNFNALAMEPMGHIAGVAAAVIGSSTTPLSGILGTLIGQAYPGTVLPLVLGFAFLSPSAFLMLGWVERPSAAASQPQATP